MPTPSPNIIPQNIMAIEIKIDPSVFNEYYFPHLRNYAREQVYYGGSSSGKSVFLAQRCVLDLLEGGRNYLVCRQVGRTIRGSVFNQIKQVIVDWNVEKLFNINKSELTITAQNGYQILFYGLDDSEKLKSVVPSKGVITDVWVEEATEANEDSIKQLLKRQRGGSRKYPKRLTLSFNPILKTHWIYRRYFVPASWLDSQTEYYAPNGRVSILKSWYIHNQFLTEDDINDLLAETDEYYRAVYTFGNWGILGNLIFTNWRIENLQGVQDQFTNRRHGLDFGFSNDPAGVVATHYDRKRGRIYIFGEIYKRGLQNDELADEINQLIPGEYIIADSAEPKSIAELNTLGVPVIGASKGKDSIRFGIKWLKKQEIIVDGSCINMQNELQQYHWKTDRDGNPIPIPVDKYNHLIDALRYAYESESLDMGAFL
jgi:phage terminase large subunit